MFMASWLISLKGWRNQPIVDKPHSIPYTHEVCTLFS